MAETRATRDARIARLEGMGVRTRFALRAVNERALTDDDIAWNAKLGRPPHWKETLDLPKEAERRAEFTRLHPPAPSVIV